MGSVGGFDDVAFALFVPCVIPIVNRQRPGEIRQQVGWDSVGIPEVGDDGVGDGIDFGFAEFLLESRPR